MKHKIIYTEHYALVVSDDEIKQGDWCVDKHDIVYKQETDKIFSKFSGAKKVIAHRPLTDAPILEGVPLLPKFSQEEDIKLIAKQEAEKLHDKSRHEDWDIYEDLVSEDAWLIEKGYNKAKETYKYTEEDLMNLVEKGHEIYNEGLGVATDAKKQKLIDFIQSLRQPKRPKYFECEMEKGYMLNDDGEPYGFPVHETGKPKTITNSQGQTELVGEYIYG